MAAKIGAESDEGATMIFCACGCGRRVDDDGVACPNCDLVFSEQCIDEAPNGGVLCVLCLDDEA